MNEDKFWDIIEEANWSSDHSYNRISHEWHEKFNKWELEELEMFIDTKHADIYSRFKSAWLGDDGNGGFDCGDDGFMDLMSEVVGRGKEFYYNITADKLREMAATGDYFESFSYCLFED
jgi:hypothetical protein